MFIEVQERKPVEALGVSTPFVMLGEYAAPGSLIAAAEVVDGHGEKGLAAVFPEEYVGEVLRDVGVELVPVEMHKTYFSGANHKDRSHDHPDYTPGKGVQIYSFPGETPYAKKHTVESGNFRGDVVYGLGVVLDGTEITLSGGLAIKRGFGSRRRYESAGTPSARKGPDTQSVQVGAGATFLFVSQGDQNVAPSSLTIENNSKDSKDGAELAVARFQVGLG